MTAYTRALICVTAVALAASAYAATGDPAVVPPNTGATEVVTPAAPPAKPATPPPGFPAALVITGAIIVGVGVAVAVDDNDSVQIPGTGTGTGTR